jgi:hypothetical protein
LLLITIHLKKKLLFSIEESGQTAVQETSIEKYILYEKVYFSPFSWFLLTRGAFLLFSGVMLDAHSLLGLCEHLTNASAQITR